jgi:hypothetical protein
MAWGMVLAHPRLGELRQEDFARLAEELGGKVRCYGYVLSLSLLILSCRFGYLLPLSGRSVCAAYGRGCYDLGVTC